MQIVLPFLYTVLAVAPVAQAETITFDELPVGTNIDGQTIKGVLFDFTPNSALDDAVILSGGFGFGSNLSPPALLLPGEFNDFVRVPATLELRFSTPTPILRFQYSASPNNFLPGISVGSLQLYDLSDSVVGTFSLFADWNPASGNQTEGEFAYSGTVPISRAVLTVANLIHQDTTPIIDTIVFQAVPEPSTVVLTFAALLAAGVHRTLTQSHQLQKLQCQVERKCRNRSSIAISTVQI